MSHAFMRSSAFLRQTRTLFRVPIVKRHFSKKNINSTSTNRLGLSVFWKWTKRSLLLGVSVVAFGGSYFVFQHRDEQNYRRSFYFWRNVYPIYFDYKYTDFKTRNYTAEDRDAAFDILHEKYKWKIYNINKELRGLYIKLAQLTAANIGGQYPQCWIEVLRKFEDECPYEPMSVVQSIVESQYPGFRFDEIFEYFDPKPLGAASIGQVHHAILRPEFYDHMMANASASATATPTATSAQQSRESLEVVIKVQYPTAEELFRGDLLLSRKFAEMAQPEHLVYIDEMEAQFKTEFDYIGEAHNLELVGNHINHHPFWKHKVVIPKAYLPLCTRLCLVMQYIKGEKLISAIKRNVRNLAQERNMSVDAFMAEQKQLDVHPSTEEMAHIKTQIKRRDRIWNLCASIVNHTFGYVFKALDFEGLIAKGTNEVIPYKHTTIPMNIKGILDLIASVHGYELLMFGAFNGDPHPGNILFCEDGRLGLIDYGQCKKLAMKERLEFAKMMVYLHDKNDEMIIKEIAEMGYSTKYDNKSVHLQAAKFYFDSDCLENTNNKNFLLFMQELEEADPAISSTDDYVFPVRLRMLIGGLFYNLGYTFYASEHWYDWAMQLLAENDISPYYETGKMSVSVNTTEPQTGIIGQN